ncbi:MAG: four-carbon acid sugar kinase family protein [Cypionkella sp.]|uniref:four-carbon acid sugar kinase family protein n=1 Tax=Cypionkella sp. TaxID=2811411 RepID=UPI002AB89CC9|nr:four-carbon acid sugar kinase family protein [Cypionkella sp.]MDZ4309626.1 four-carbon acid sugar kinase family protein [Cypionkella sp.]
MDNNTPFLVGIIADDLTSATDGAAPFLAKGHAPLIARDTGGVERRAVVAIDTHSRASTTEMAEMATAAAVAALAEARLLFKTIDSTLRGHVRAEIVAAFRASRRTRLVIAPAFPEAGRLTVGGIQHVNGVPVSDSVYGRDPVHPALTSRIADLVDPSLGQPVILSQVGSDVTAPVLILDADSQSALNWQVRRIPDPETVLWVGSPGLAIALATLVATAPKGQPTKDEIACRVLIVAGSANPVAHGQCDALQAQGVRVVTDLTEAPGDAPVLCLRAPPERQNAAAVLVHLVTQAATALARRDYDVVIATGGETMAAILDRLGIRRFTLAGEMEPGFPVGRAEQMDGTLLTIAMKAGGFGTPATLLNAARALSGGTISRKALTND